MKPFDKRRLKAFIKDELEAVKEYDHMSNEMKKIGQSQNAYLFYKNCLSLSCTGIIIAHYMSVNYKLII